MADWSEWERAEEEVRSYLAEDISESIDVAGEVEAIAFELMRAASVPGTNPELFIVHANLLTRALQDLRVCCTTAVSGYTMQSWTLAASCMEASYTVGFIGADQDKAREWQEHSNPHRSPWNMYDCLLHSQRYLGIETDTKRLEERAREEYMLYQHLCMAKHVNPIAERNRYLDSRTGRMYVTPAFSDNMPHEARLGIALAARSATVGVWAVRKAHFPSKHDLDDRIVETARRGLQLIKRWQEGVPQAADGSEEPSVE